MLRDRVTDELREVDVYVETTAGEFKVGIGFEVVSWSRPADTPWVEKMRAKHDNLPTDKLVLVSEKGFSKHARRKADFYGIEALTLEQATEADWPVVAKLAGSGVFEIMTVDFEIRGILQFNDGSREQIPPPKSASPQVSILIWGR